MSASPSTTSLPSELIEFVESGVVAYMATRNEHLMPTSAKVLGARVAPGGQEFTLLLPEAGAERVLADLKQVPEVAVTFTRPITNQSIQLKGKAQSWGAADDSHRVSQMRYLAALEEQLSLVGVPRSVVRRFVAWPALAVKVRLESVFEQTPGPAAGRKWAPGAGV